MDTTAFMRKVFLLLTTVLLLVSCGGEGVKHTVGGSVVDSSGAGIGGAVVTMGSLTFTTDSSGKYGWMHIDNGTFTIAATLQGAIMTPATLTVTVHDSDVFGLNFIVYWRPVIPGTPNNLNGISFVNKFNFAAGDKGTILYASDGRNWTVVASGTSQDLYGVTFGNSKYVAVGANGTILNSPDAQTWTAVSSLGTTANIFDITYDSTAGIFVAVGGSGTILTSADGVTWSPATSGTSKDLFRVASLYNSSAALYVLYAVGASGTILTSNDGKKWSPLNSGTANDLFGITNGLLTGNTAYTYVAVGANGTVLVSPDGQTWFPSGIGSSDLLSDVAFGGTNFVAVSTGSHNIFTSPDGQVWTPRATDNSGAPPPLKRIVFGNGAFVAVGNAVNNNGAMFWSSVPIIP